MASNKPPISYREFMMSKIEGHKLSDGAREMLEEYVSHVKQELVIHPDTYAGTVHSFFQEFVKDAEELVKFGFFKKSETTDIR